jgi:hypothetical protein
LNGFRISGADDRSRYVKFKVQSSRFKQNPKSQRTKTDSAFSSRGNSSSYLRFGFVLALMHLFELRALNFELAGQVLEEAAC